jgi:hypothetical protein
MFDGLSMFAGIVKQAETLNNAGRSWASAAGDKATR